MMRKILLQFVIAMGLAMFFVACGNSGTTEPAARDRERQESEENHVTNDTGTLDPTPSPTPTLDPTPTPPPVQMLNVTIGEIISFGGYDWRVLEIDGNYAKLLTEDIIFYRAYHNTEGVVTWATSDIRAYLNGTFFNSFSAADRARIRQTTVINSDNQWRGTSGGADTNDRIFLLSIEEVVRYLGDSEQLRNEPTPDAPEWWLLLDGYHEARIARNAEGRASWWWLRSPGFHSDVAALVGGGGFLAVSGGYGSWAEGGIRPALWLNLESETLGAPDPAPTPTPTPPPVQSVTVGEIIQFGGYDWRVLDIDGNYAKILTENIISDRVYHNSWEDVTWAASDTRAYLNETFFNSFSATDRVRIRQTTVINYDNQWFGTSGGANTTDRIFLLSIEEVVRYFGDSGQLANQNHSNNEWWGFNDRYSNARIAQNAEGTAWWWWLRSPGGDSGGAAGVYPGGGLGMSGYAVSWAGGGVRPALWLNLSYVPTIEAMPIHAPENEPEDLTQADGLLVANENELRAAIGQAGSTPTTIILTADIDLISNFAIPGNANIKLRSPVGRTFRLNATRDMDVVAVPNNASLTIENIKITRSLGTTGRGVINAGTFIMNSGIISGHTISFPNHGGGVLSSGTFIMHSGEISENNAHYGGGVRSSGTFVLYNGKIINNVASTSASGGGIYNTGTFTMHDALIQNNTAGTGGGIAHISTITTFIMHNGTISNNQASGGGHPRYRRGGGIYIRGSFVMYDGTISYNTAGGSGGGIHFSSLNRSFTLNGGFIRNNTAGISGGGIHIGGRFIMNEGIIKNNSAINGGGINLAGTAVINNGIINNNNATNDGGGIYVSREWFTLEGGIVSNNIAARDGGGVNVSGGSFIMNSGSINNNTANASGGGVSTSTWFIMNSGTIYSNTARSYGGGVNHLGGTFTFDGGWIFNNIASDTNIAQGGTFNNNVFDVNVGAIGSQPPL